MGFLLLNKRFVFYRPSELSSICLVDQKGTLPCFFLCMEVASALFCLSLKCEAPFVLVKMRKMFVFLVAVTVLAAFVLAAKPTRESELSTGYERSPPAMTISRKLKHGNIQIPKTNKNRISGKIDLQDYYPIDPAPSTKAAIKSGPIEHGAPLMPYIPRPSPPYHPKHIGESP